MHDVAETVQHFDGQIDRFLYVVCLRATFFNLSLFSDELSFSSQTTNCSLDVWKGGRERERERDLDVWKCVCV